MLRARICILRVEEVCFLSVFGGDGKEGVYYRFFFGVTSVWVACMRVWSLGCFTTPPASYRCSQLGWLVDNMYIARTDWTDLNEREVSMIIICFLCFHPFFFFRECFLLVCVNVEMKLVLNLVGWQASTIITHQFVVSVAEIVTFYRQFSPRQSLEGQLYFI